MNLRLQGEKLAELLAALQAIEEMGLRRQRPDIWPTERMSDEAALSEVAEPYNELAQTLMHEADWSALGLRTAVNRLGALASRVPEQLTQDELLPEQAAGFEARVADAWDDGALLAYRAHLAFVTIAECYFWMHAVWDRMGLATRVVAFRRREARRAGWRSVWAELQSEYGDVEAVTRTRPWSLMTQLHSEGFEEIARRRHGLVHRSSIAGMLAMPEDPVQQDQLRRFIYDMQPWTAFELQALCDEVQAHRDTCGAARAVLPALLHTLNRARA